MIAYLVETNIASIFTETLTTNVEVILADKTGTMRADSTIVNCQHSIDLSLTLVFFSFSPGGLYFRHGQNYKKKYIPGTRTFTERLGVRVPNVSVGHFL